MSDPGNPEGPKGPETVDSKTQEFLTNQRKIFRGRIVKGTAAMGVIAGGTLALDLAGMHSAFGDIPLVSPIIAGGILFAGNAIREYRALGRGEAIK